MASKKAAKTPSPQTSKTQSSPGNVWPPNNCTPLCPLPSGCSHSGKHHELIMTLFKSTKQANDIEKSDFIKTLDKFMKAKWIRDDSIPDKNDKLCFPLVHWACIFGRHKLLEYLVSEKGFQLTVKVGKNQEGPLFSMVQHLSTGMHPKCSREYLGSIFGNVVDVFLRNIPEGLFERESSDNNTILHFCAKRCSDDPYSRKFLEVLLTKIKDSDKFPSDKEEEILSAVNKKGDTFLHLMVADEMSTETLTYFFTNFSKFSENISKAKNNFGKTPRQIAVEQKSFKMLKALGAPDVVINSLKKAMSVVPNNSPKNSPDTNKTSPQKEKGAPKTVTKPSPSVNGTSSNKENQNSKTSSNQLSSAVKNTHRVSFAEQPEVVIISDGQLQTEGVKMCSCDPAPSAEEKEQSLDSNTPTKKTLEPFPQRHPGTNVNSTTPEKSPTVTENNVAPSVSEKEESMCVDDINSAPDLPGEGEVDSKPEDRNVFLSLANSISSFTKKRPAPGGSRAKGPRQKRGRTADLSSDSDSDVEEDADFALDDDSDDDTESAEEEEEEEEEEDEEDQEDENEEKNDADDVQQEEMEGKSLDEPDVELEAIPKHTPFCGKTCTSQHHRLLLSLLKCSNYSFGAAFVDSFIKQVKEYVNQLGKFSDVRANADLPDPLPSFKYPLVHWVCVLGKFKVLEKLAAMKEFNLGVQSERTGETGLHRMLLSLDQAMVRKKSPTKTVLEVFSKTLRTLTDNLASIITVCNKEGDTPFHCLAKVILDSTGELERMNIFEGYFEHLVKELNRLKTSDKLTAETMRELLLKTNNNQETFLHILACRHGVGHRVIKSVLKNIEPEIMAVLKETVNADGKTPSDLAEDLCSYEMAAILRPRDPEISANDFDDYQVEELPQTPEKSALLESPDMNSPPAALFHPMEYAMSPYSPDGTAARVRLFSVKKEPSEEGPEDGPSVGPSENSLDEVNDSAGPSNVQDDAVALLPVFKMSPNKAKSPTSAPIAEQDMNARASPSANGRAENTTAASTSVSANQNKNSNTEPSIMSELMRMPGLVQSLHNSVQTKLTQSQKEMKEKEDALSQVHQRRTDLEERKRKLLEELGETWNEIAAAAREEGVLQAEITAKKRDVEAFKVELTKYESKGQLKVSVTRT